MAENNNELENDYLINFAVDKTINNVQSTFNNNLIILDETVFHDFIFSTFYDQNNVAEQTHNTQEEAEQTTATKKIKSDWKIQKNI